MVNNNYWEILMEMFMISYRPQGPRKSSFRAASAAAAGSILRFRDSVPGGKGRWVGRVRLAGGQNSF